MTRCCTRNLVSRNDSRTGAWAIMRDCAGGGVGGVGGWPGVVGAGRSITGGAGNAPSAPGRALSIRLSNDISFSPWSGSGVGLLAAREQRAPLLLLFG